MLYLREELGKELTGKLLMVFGLQSSSPLELTWECPGAPSTGSIEASPCSNDQDNDRFKYNVMVGGQQPKHPFYGNFCCQNCHRKFERRELSLLEEAETDLDGDGMERLELLRGRELKRKAFGRVDRDKRIEKKGLAAVREAELSWSRSSQSRKTEMYEKYPEAYARASAANREAEQKRIEAGGKKKKPGHSRKLVANKMYPPYFMNMLTQATRIWARELGEKYVYWNDLVKLFGLLLIREHKERRLDGVVVDRDGLPKYLDLAYRAAAEEVLDQCETRKQNWEYRDHIPKMIGAKKQQKAVLYPIVVIALYKEIWPEPTPMQQGAPE
jgi:hypothetical protein